MLKHIDRVTAGIIGGAVLLIAAVIAIGVITLGGSEGADREATPPSPSTSAPSSKSTTTTTTTTADETATPTPAAPATAGLPPTTGPLPELPALDDEVKAPTVSFLETGIPLADRVDAGALTVATSEDPCDLPDAPEAADVVNEVASTPDGVLGELWQAQGADLALLEFQCQDQGTPDGELVTNIVTRAHLIQARKDQL